MKSFSQEDKFSLKYCYIKGSNITLMKKSFPIAKHIIRPQLEYCSNIWHPWQKILTYTIERVPRSAARYVLNNNDYQSSVTQMLSTIKWNSLEHRRLYNSLIFFYKIRSQAVSFDQVYLIHARNLNNLIPQSRTQYHYNSYFPRIIRYWNNFSPYIKIKSQPQYLCWEAGDGHFLNAVYSAFNCNVMFFLYFTKQV